MVQGKKLAAQGLHPRNLHGTGYDFKALVKAHPPLADHVIQGPSGRETIDFSRADSVKALNRGLLSQFYGIGYWDIPPGFLCPPVPGRVDYIHYLADLLAESQGGTIPRGPGIRVLDIGTGANCIYPLVGAASYGWRFVGTDIHPQALSVAKGIVEANPSLANLIEFRLQGSSKDVFSGILRPDDSFSLTLCNPPFHASLGEARDSTKTRLSKMGLPSPTVGESNFGGTHAELWCPGGEVAFIRTMITQSALFPSQSRWFTSLVAKGEHLHVLYHGLRLVRARDVRTIPMAQGQKVSRILAWTFCNP